MKRIPVAGPWITQKEIDTVSRAAADAWYENAGLYPERFERAFAAYIGRRSAVSLPSCTSALHLALLAHGIGPGAEVIVPEITWIATAAPIQYVGATPVFADVDPVSWCLCPRSLEACITPRTRAVIVVDLYGGMAAMDRIEEIAAAHGLALIEDAAQAVGSEYRGRRAGSFGHTSTFSFHGSKTLTTGEGGMLLTDDPEHLERILFLRDHGRSPGDRMFRNTEVAYKYRMSSLQAALGLAQLERVEELVGRKRQIFAWYQEALGDIPGLTLNAAPPGVRNSYWMTTALWDPALGLVKEQVMAALSDRGIDSRPFFHPLSDLPAYAGHPQALSARARNRVAYRLAPYGVNLPSSLSLTQDQALYVSECLKEIVRRA